MNRTIIKIDENLCNGCGICVDNCHEGALQLINGKAVMVSAFYCDGLGACIGECPVEAIKLEEREAEPYDEHAVMDRLVAKGEAVVSAHLQHLKDHNQDSFLQIATDYLKEHHINWEFPFLISKSAGNTPHTGSGCPGSRQMSFTISGTNTSKPQVSALAQWPIQLHLLSPHAPFLHKADLLLAADCVAFSTGDFHAKHLQGKRLAIACPKLDADKQLYVDKLATMIDENQLNSLTVMIMEVPCCNGLLKLAQKALEQAERKIPLTLITVTINLSSI